MKAMDSATATTTGLSPKLLGEICELAARHSIGRVVLYGSRARGDFHRTSDIDLAVQGGNVVRFALDLEDETSTLLRYDCVDLSAPIRSEMRESVERDGRVIYDQAR